MGFAVIPEFTFPEVPFGVRVALAANPLGVFIHCLDIITNKANEAMYVGTNEAELTETIRHMAARVVSNEEFETYEYKEDEDTD